MPAPKDPVKYEEWRRKLKESHSSPEVREKLSEAAKSRRGYKHSEETKAKIGKANKGKPPWIKGKCMPETTKEKIRQTLRGHPVSVEARRKMSKKARAYYSNKEAREEASRRSKALWANPDYRKKVCEAQRKKRLSPEHKEKLSLVMREIRNRPEVKAQTSRLSKEAMARPETKEKLRASLKRALSKPEAKEKLRQHAKRQWEGGLKYRVLEALKRPEVQKKMNERRREALSRTEVKEKRRKSMKLAWADPQKRDNMLSSRVKNYLERRTSIELAIEQVLKTLNITYEPQKKIGWYIVDFYLPDYNLVIECDGEYWHNLPENIARDKRKDAYLRKRGYNILRLKEHEIKEDPKAALLNGLKVVS